MPKFEKPFAGDDRQRTMNNDEVLRAIRFAIAAEYEAVQMYEQIATASSDPKVQVVMASVAREELVHAGEFLALLKRLSPDDGATAIEGTNEVEAMLRKIK